MNLMGARTLADLAQEVPQDQNQPSGQSLSQLGQMLEAYRERMSPHFQWRLIDPGMTWGGRDRNAVMPNDVMQNYLLPQQPETP